MATNVVLIPVVVLKVVDQIFKVLKLFHFATNRNQISHTD